MSELPPIGGIDVRDARAPEEVLDARQIHGRCYLDAGYVDELSPEGTIDDIWVEHSEYKVAVDTATGEVVGTCRLIRTSPVGFPIFKHFEMTDEATAVFAAVDPDKCVEVSALASQREGRQNLAISAALYAAVWQAALLGGHPYMLATMDYRLYRILRRQFKFPFELLGAAQNYMGSTTVPVAMFVPRTIREFRESQLETLTYFSGPISLDKLDELEIDLRDEVPEYRPVEIDVREPSERPVAP